MHLFAMLLESVLYVLFTRIICHRILSLIKFIAAHSHLKVQLHLLPFYKSSCGKNLPKSSIRDSRLMLRLTHLVLCTSRKKMNFHFHFQEKLEVHFRRKCTSKPAGSALPLPLPTRPLGSYSIFLKKHYLQMQNALYNLLNAIYYPRISST